MRLISMIASQTPVATEAFAMTLFMTFLVHAHPALADSIVRSTRMNAMMVLVTTVAFVSTRLEASSANVEMALQEPDVKVISTNVYLIHARATELLTVLN